jgi:hypothetical protein
VHHVPAVVQAPPPHWEPKAIPRCSEPRKLRASVHLGCSANGRRRTRTEFAGYRGVNDCARIGFRMPALTDELGAQSAVSSHGVRDRPSAARAYAYMLERISRVSVVRLG